MIGISVLAKPLIVVVLTEKWLPAAIMMSILALDGLWAPINRINQSLLQSVGRSDLFLKLEIYKKTIAITILLIFISHGLVWICIGRLIYSVIALLINMYYTVDIIGKSYFNQIADWIVLLLVSLLMGGIVYICNLFITNAILQLVVGVLVGVVSYYLMSKVFRLKELDKAKQMLLSLIKKQ